MRSVWVARLLLTIALLNLSLILEEAFSQAASIPSSSEEKASGWPTFKKHVIDEEFSAGYQVSTADLDGDQRLDILALSINPTQLVWYRNPNWRKRAIDVPTEHNVDLAPYDVDGDGDMDLALSSQFALSKTTSGGAVQWLEQVGSPRRWNIHPIDVVPTSHRVRWADLDGDGRMELLNLPILGVGASPPRYEVGVVFKAYRIPKDPTNDEWPVTELDRSLEMAHGLRIVDWDGDGRAEVLTASFGGVHLLRYGSGSWHLDRIGTGQEAPRPAQGASEVALGKRGGKRFIATIEPWHGDKVVVYDEEDPDRLPWRRSIIDTSFLDGHALLCADIDGDGNHEIVAGYRGKGYSLFIYRFSANLNRWERISLDKGGISAAGLVVADLNQNGWIDLIATGSATHNVVWYENLGP